MNSYISLIFSAISFLGVLIGAYVLYGIGLYGMLRSCGFKKPFFAFLPFFRVFALGSLAEVFNDGRKVKKHGRTLLFLSIAYFLINTVYSLAYCIVIKEPIMDLINSAIALPDNASADTITAIVESFYVSVELESNALLNVLSLATSVISIIYSLSTCLVLFKVFAIFTPNRAFIFAIISIFSSIAQAIILFILRNRKPQNLRWQRENDFQYPEL